MASNPQLHLMTKLLNIEGVTVKSYQIIENIAILNHYQDYDTIICNT